MPAAAARLQPARAAATMAGMDLVWPSLALLPAYVDALERGWSPDNERGRD